MKKILLALFLALPLSVFAQTAREEIQKDITLSASNYVCYRAPENPTYTAAPKGYKPCYISSYARHGSRWLIYADQYASPSRKLHRADTLGVLTPLGKEVMRICDTLVTMSQGHLGELTDVGAEQHRGIARRMYRNWPEVFAKNRFIEARSTPIVRCILSMMNEMWELKRFSPTLDMRMDGSNADYYYLHDPNHPANKLRGTEAEKAAYWKLDDSVKNDIEKLDAHLAGKLFTDIKKASRVVNVGELRDQLFTLAGNMQSHRFGFDLYRLFTADEAYLLWSRQNLMWYANYGFTPWTSNAMPYTQSNLLRDFIAAADSCLARPKMAANLRFGHEVCVLPLACLMGLGEAGYSTDNPLTLADHWRNYRIFTMASNIQLVFFRNDKKSDAPILVKPLLNEREVTLPVAAYVPGFYRWSDVRAYWFKILEKEPGA